jgi:hypothetical protein
MERVTHIDKDGWYINGANVATVFHSGTGEIRMRGKDIDRLAAYEDAGLEPEKIEQLKGEVFGLKVDKQELEQVKRERRIIPKGYALVKLKLLEELDNFRELGPIDRLRKLKQADDEGRCVVLPCKVGDTVYQLGYMTHSEAIKSGVAQRDDPLSKRKYGRKRAAYRPLIVREKKMVKTLYHEFGKTVFLTREEAEAALEGMKNG